MDANALRAERKTLRDQLTQPGKDFATALPEFTEAALSESNGGLDEDPEVVGEPDPLIVGRTLTN
jgi:hypothetical protein